MRPAEQGVLLLTSFLGDPDRKPLTAAQFRVLAERVRSSSYNGSDRELMTRDVKALGYGEEMAGRIVALLSEEDLLDHYLRAGARSGCIPQSRVSAGYPYVLSQRLFWESPV